MAHGKTSLLTWLSAGLFSVIAVSCIYHTNSSSDNREARNLAAQRLEAAKSPAQKASEAAAAKQQAADFDFAVNATKAVVQSLKNPASFEFVEAGLIRNGALCLTYRGTNSFNAVITEKIAIKRNFSKGEWNRDCAGKSGADMGHVRQAL